MKIEESLNVTFDETLLPSKTSPLVDDYLDEEEAIKFTEKKNLENDIEVKTLGIDKTVNIKESKNHPLDNIIGNLNQTALRSQAQNQKEDVFSWLDEVFDGAFRGVRDEEVVVGEVMAVTSSLLEMLTNNCLGGIMVSLIFFEGLEEEA
nr:hypothetical protein CTI12_AA182560 [Tanacetum cinerariifolium]